MKPATTRRKPAAKCEPNSQAQTDKTMPNSERPNMRVTEIFDRSASDHSLKPLDQAELTALEAILFEKNDRLYFRCPVRNKDILAKPEEAVRQLWILRLTKHYGYPISRLAVEYPITARSSLSKCRRSSIRQPSMRCRRNLRARDPKVTPASVVSGPTLLTGIYFCAD